MSGRAYKPPFPCGPRDNADVPRYLREMQEWREACARAAIEDQRTDFWSMVFVFGGAVAILGVMLWVML